MGKTFNCNYDKERLPRKYEEGYNNNNNLLLVNNRSNKLNFWYKIELKTIFENEYKNIRLMDSKEDNKIDIILKNKKIIKIYGCVEDENKLGIEGAIVILYKEIQRGYNIDKIEVGEIITDCTGMFVFIEEYIDDNINYKVKLVNN